MVGLRSTGSDALDRELDKSYGSTGGLGDAMNDKESEDAYKKAADAARDQINQDANKTAAQKNDEINKINDAQDQFNKAAGGSTGQTEEDKNKDQSATVRTQIKLSEIKSIENLDNTADGPRRVTLLDGRQFIVTNENSPDLRQGVVKDFENQQRVVGADADAAVEDITAGGKTYKNLFDLGYGLVGETDLPGILDNIQRDDKGTPIYIGVSKAGPNITIIEFKGKDGKTHKYFAHNGHSQKAYDEFEKLRINHIFMPDNANARMTDKKQD